MAAIELELKDEKLKRYFAAFGKSVNGEMKKALAQTGMRFEDRFVRKRMSRHGPGSLGTRTGQLKRSIKRTVAGAKINDISLRIAFALADDKKSLPWVHEEGKTITPRTCDWLWIPTKDAKTKAGVPRGGPRDFIAGRITTPKVDSYFLGKEKDGRRIFFGVKKWAKPRTVAGKKQSAKLIPLFVLKKSVKIPKRLNFRYEFRSYFSPGGAGIKVLARRWSEQLAKRSAV